MNRREFIMNMGAAVSVASLGSVPRKPVAEVLKTA